MSWRSWLADDPVDWLMESDDPCVRYNALRYALHREESSAEVRKVREEMRLQGPVERILARQDPGGFWGKPEDFYNRSKYRGTVWNIILLADLGADPNDERVRRAGEFILDWSRKEDGTFTHIGGPKGGSGGSLPCLTANMVYALGQLGFADDPRLKESREAIVRHVSAAETDCLRDRCSTCRSGMVKELKALTMSPDPNKNAVMGHVEIALAETIFRRCLPRKANDSQVRKEWHRFGFPLFYNTDLIEIVHVLACSGIEVERLRATLDIILAKREGGGVWVNEHSYHNRTLTKIESEGSASRWVTLRVLRMLDSLHSQNG